MPAAYVVPNHIEHSNIDADPCWHSMAVSWRHEFPGLTAKEHAAIMLRAPASGTPWLDAMIREARVHDLAAQLAAAWLGGFEKHPAGNEKSEKEFAVRAYTLAASMLDHGLDLAARRQGS